MPEENTALVDLGGRPLSEVFQPEPMDAMIEQIREKAMAHVPDLTTAKGRKAIASNAQSVARSKTFLDGKGKELVAEIKAKTSKIDAERKKLRDACDVIKAEVRKPLTDWEAEQQKLLDQASLDLNYLRCCHEFSITDIHPSEIVNIIDRARSINPDEAHDDLKDQIINAKEMAISVLREKLEQRNQYDSDQAELAKLRRINEQREAEERERIRKEEAEKAEQQRKEREEQAEKDRVAREAQAEADRIAYEAKVRRSAEDRAQIDRAKAIKDERTRVKAKKLAEDDKERKRLSNVKHCKKVEGESFTSLTEYCSSNGFDLDDSNVLAIINAIRDGKITNLKIEY